MTNNTKVIPQPADAASTLVSEASTTILFTVLLVCYSTRTVVVVTNRLFRLCPRSRHADLTFPIALSDGWFIRRDTLLPLHITLRTSNNCVSEGRGSSSLEGISDYYKVLQHSGWSTHSSYLLLYGVLTPQHHTIANPVAVNTRHKPNPDPQRRASEDKILTRPLTCPDLPDFAFRPSKGVADTSPASALRDY